MKNQPKLKRGRDYLLVLLMAAVAVMYLAGSIIEAEKFGTHYSSWLYGAIIILFCIVFFFRYRVYSFAEALMILLGGIITGLGAWHYELAEHMETVFSKGTFQFHVSAITIYFIIAVPLILVRRKKGKLYSRQIFEVAARPISDAVDGFTSRPYPAGKAEYSREDAIGLGKYLSKKLIAVPHVEDDRVILAFSTGMRHFGKPDLEKISYVPLDSGGNISVNVAREDYDQYRDELTFDKLCESLGDLFKRFLDYYKTGKTGQIAAALYDHSMRVRVYTIIGFSAMVFGLFFLGVALCIFLTGR